MSTPKTTEKAARKPLLKPLACPFCGGKPKINRQPADSEMPTGWWSVHCQNIKACNVWPCCVGDTRAEAVLGWNRRAK